METHQRWDAVRHQDGRAELRLADERALHRVMWRRWSRPGTCTTTGDGAGERLYARWGFLAVFVTSVIVSGTAKMPPYQFALWNLLDADQYWSTRAPAVRLSAAASQQSRVVASRTVLETQVPCTRASRLALTAPYHRAKDPMPRMTR